MKKKFDCVEMTRKIRDQLHERYKDLSLEEYNRIIIREARKSDLWKELHLDARVVDSHKAMTKK